MAGYRPEAAPCDLTLIAAEERRDGDDTDPQLGWGRLVEGELVAQVVPGDHHTLLRPPGVDRLAAILRAVLDGRGAP